MQSLDRNNFSLNETVLLFENFKVIKVTSYSSSHWKGPSDIEKLISLEWNKKVEEAKKTNSLLFNGPLIRVKQMEKVGLSLHLELEHTDYAHHVFTRKNQNLERRANPLYIAILPITKDGFLIFGKSLATEAQWKNKCNILAGGVLPGLDEIDGVPQPSLTLVRELFEETGLLLNHFENQYLQEPHFQYQNQTSKEGPPRPLCVICDWEMFHPSIVYWGSLKLTKMQVEKVFQTGRKVYSSLMFDEEGEEFSQLEFIPFTVDSLLQEAQKMDNYHARAIVVLKYLASII